MENATGCSKNTFLENGEPLLEAKAHASTSGGNGLRKGEDGVRGQPSLPEPCLVQRRKGGRAAQQMGAHRPPLQEVDSL